MSDTNCIVHKKCGINHITLAPAHKYQASRFGVIDGALLLGFVAVFVGLVVLLAQ